MTYLNEPGYFEKLQDSCKKYPLLIATSNATDVMFGRKAATEFLDELCLKINYLTPALEKGILNYTEFLYQVMFFNIVLSLDSVFIDGNKLVLNVCTDKLKKFGIVFHHKNVYTTPFKNLSWQNNTCKDGTVYVYAEMDKLVDEVSHLGHTKDEG